MGGRVNSKFELGLFAVVYRETFQKQSAETRTSTASKGVGEEEALETGTIVCNTSNSVHDLVNELFAHGIVATCVVVCSVLLASNELFWMKQILVLSSSNLVNNVGFQIYVNSSGNVFAIT